MTRRRTFGGSPRRRRGAAAVAALAVLGGFALAVGRLPRPPGAAPGGAGRQVSTARRLALVAETVALTGGETGWATLPAGPFWRVVRTTDGGRSWRDVTPVGAATDGGLDLSAITPAVAAVAYRPDGYARRSAFAVTEDAGARWTVGVLPGAAAGPASMAVLGGDRLLAILGGGRVVVSRDGGASWSPLHLPRGHGLPCRPLTVRFGPRAAGWIGAACRGRAAVWATTDAGASWRLEPLPLEVATRTRSTTSVPQPLTTGAIVATALASGTGGQQLTVLRWGGGRWRRAGAVRLARGPVVSAAAGAQVWAASLGGGVDRLSLERSRDGGARWRQVATTIPSAETAALSVAASGLGLLVGEGDHQPRLWRSGRVAAWRSQPFVLKGIRIPPYGQA